jgi:6-phospho-beta-glucosidase
VVGGLAGRMLAGAGWERPTLTTDRDQALEGADFIIIQLRVGGQEARLLDETLPPQFGFVGQETTGPGGFAKALRTVPVVLELAEAAARRASAGAWIVDFTNPTGIVTQALLDEGYRAIGLCNVAIGFQRRFADLLHVEPDRVELEHVGLNHLSWERRVSLDGSDVLPDLLERNGDAIAAEIHLPLELIRALGAIPSYYLRFYYLTAEVLEEQRTHPSRAEEVIRIERELLQLYRDPALTEKPTLLDQRGGAHYSEAAAQLVASLHDGREDVQVVDVHNDGALPELAAHDVVEVPARIGRDGARPLPLTPLAHEMRALVEHAKAYEQLAVKAAVTGDRKVALMALLTNPLVGDYSAASPLLDALLVANRPYLPRFFQN